MKNNIIVLFLSLNVFFLKAQSKLPFFQGSFEELKERAAVTEKYFLVDFYTSWCGYCKKMDKTTFKDENVVSYVRKHFIAYKIDAEKGEGTELAQKYGVRGFPTVLVFNKSGKLIGKVAGYKTALPFLQDLEKYTKKSASETLPKIETYFEQKKNYYDHLFLSLEMSKSKEQLNYEKKALLFGKQRNYFELDELTYQLEQEKSTFIPNVQLAFYKAQNNEQKIIQLINEQLEKEQMSLNELHYYSLFFIEKGAVTVDVLRWVNKIAQETKSLETYDTKALVQYLLGDTHDAQDTIKKMQKMAKKQKKEIPQSTVILKQLL